jgi:hypothetical protein
MQLLKNCWYVAQFAGLCVWGIVVALFNTLIRGMSAEDQMAPKR